MPITHVGYIVRKNRTYDQVYRDLATARNDVDADPAFKSLSNATPQGRKLTGRFAGSDSFFSDGRPPSRATTGRPWPTSTTASSTAVVIVKDDSQDGPDQVDGYLDVLLVASTYAGQVSANGCYAGHAHNDQAVVLRTIELTLGLLTPSSYDKNAAPWVAPPPQTADKRSVHRNAGAQRARLWPQAVRSGFAATVAVAGTVSPTTALGAPPHLVTQVSAWAAPGMGSKPLGVPTLPTTVLPRGLGLILRARPSGRGRWAGAAHAGVATAAPRPLVRAVAG